MIDVDEARRRLFATARRTAAETVPLSAATGRVLAAPVTALRNQPPFAASAMDGYAVRAADLSAPLQVVGEAAAGGRFERPLGQGEAVRIFTGAPVPEGADAVLIQEDVTRTGDTITTTETLSPGANMREAALDFAQGDILLPAGLRLAPRHVALAGAGGHGTVPVQCRPRVAILATGDELVVPGAPLGADSIVASTTPAIAAMVEAAGGVAVDLGIAPDDQAEIARRARAGLDEADILVTLGGASVGDHDLVRPALADLGIALDFWKVAVRPGKPLMFAPEPLVLGLPGNPVSGVVCTILFLVPLVEAMLGIETPGPTLHDGILAAALPKNGPRRDHVRARRTESGLAAFDRQDSSMLAILSRADALIVRQPHAPAAQPGEPCVYIAL
ncbi:molybdopterin molybdotransferase MoeA [Acuticoccus sp. MNP-M23]|uniref:molybdopterin molybdotransferase MoeA n=1 Tax=Acuticoccus sp. MNP-M23 TaxID=3072793 RepID=UPI00281501DB|nr:gephyrin-like molybdotransferase Glp [Acuticoccus sp. MNP-M23]WMS41319.1 molybdopterin molybdotransferase MoeA [Acuticoccus sp. MNP-M23]